MFKYFYSLFKLFIKSVFKIKNILYNCNINQTINKNFTIVKNLYINNNTSIIKKILIKEKRKKIVEQKTQIYVIQLFYRFNNLFQKTCLL